MFGADGYPATCTVELPIANVNGQLRFTLLWQQNVTSNLSIPRLFISEITLNRTIGNGDWLQSCNLLEVTNFTR